MLKDNRRKYERQACTKRRGPASLSLNNVDATRPRTASPAVVVGVDAASWSREAWELETLKNLMADTLAVAGVDHRREQDDDGNAGYESVGRVARQLDERMAARKRKQKATSGGSERGHDSRREGSPRAFRRATYRLELEEDGQQRRCGTRRHTYQQMRWLMFMILPNCACQCISVTRTHTVVGQWRGRVRRATVDEWARATSEQPHSQLARVKQKVRSPGERATASPE